MSGVVSERMAKKDNRYQEYKGKPAWKWDVFMKFLLKMFFQVLIFSAIYYFNIEYIRKEYDYNPIMIFIVIMEWMILTDIIVAITVWIFKTILLYKLKYIPNNKKNNNAGLWLWEYIIYVGIRSFCYVILLTTLLTTIYSRAMPEPIAFFLAWASISLGSHLISKVGAIAITMR